MKQKFFLFVIFHIIIIVKVQCQDPCGFGQVMQSLIAQNPNSQPQNLLNSNGDGPCIGSYQIPMVIHVLHNNGPENITDAQIFEAIDQLNNQFAGGEGGYNTNISFYLANVDPDGNCTNGINRIQTNTPGFVEYGFGEYEQSVKNLHGWPVANYLNVWVVDYIGTHGVVGYAYLIEYLPSNFLFLDGVTILNTYLGTTGTATPDPTTIGDFENVLAHEVGHYFNLLHVWGLDVLTGTQTQCSENCHDIEDCNTHGDRVCDTEPCCRGLYGSGGCNVPIDMCGPNQCDCKPANPNAIYPKDNYMSYYFDCQNKFTQGQATRMCRAITTYRSSLSRPKIEGCNNDCITNIITNTTFDSPRNFGGDLVVKSGATLTVTTNLKFAQANSIIVESGGKLILQNNAILDKCPSAMFWNGIRIQSGGELNGQHSYINNAKTGIWADNNSKIDLNDIDIDGLNNNFGTGIYLNGAVNAVQLHELVIVDYYKGIEAWGSNTIYEISDCQIGNVNFGIFIVGNTLLLSNSVITGSSKGILLWKSTGSVINGNQIGYSDIGIEIGKSPYVSLTENTVGWPTNRGKIAISLSTSGGSAISNNSQLQANQFGLRLWKSDALVDYNNINVFGQNNQAGGAIQDINSTGSQILQNYIDVDHSSFGVETNLAVNTRIENNQVDHFSTISTRTAAIRSMGSMDEVIEENVINGVANTTGMITQNSMGNHYDCNITTNTAEGLGVYYNSEEQEITGNEFNAAIDLAIRSVVGLQPHHGNKFFGGSVRANELSFETRVNSQFKANPSITHLWPADIQPNDGSWWIGEPNLNHYNCDGNYGPGWVPFGNDPNRLCTYWNYLKSIQTTSPEVFFVKLFHLLKYSKIKSGFNIPNCIKLDPVFQTLCGLTILVNVNMALDEISKYNVNATNLSNLQLQYAQTQTQAGKSAIKNQLIAEFQIINPEVDASQIKDSLKLDSIEIELNSINCTQLIINKWKEILKLYIKFLKTGEIVLNDRKSLLAFSSDCSDIYGDAIHLARAMTNTFDDTYFDTSDGCIQQSGPRTKSILSSTNDINVYPNPSTGILYIQLPEKYEGQVSIYTIDSKLVTSKIIHKSNLSTLDVSNLEGMFIIQFLSLEGKVVSKRIVVLKQ